MPQIRLNRSLTFSSVRRGIQVAGDTVREALDAAFVSHPPLRGEMLDADGRLREQVVLFVDGGMVEDRDGLTDPLDQDSELLVMRAG